MTTTVKSRYVGAVDTAKLLRKALKDAFPGVKFSVRTSTYAGGASIQVRYTDGPIVDDVEAVAQQFAGGRFDGMIDLKYHAEHWLTPDGRVVLRRTYGHSFDTDDVNDDVPAGSELVHFGADYVFVDRDLSPEFAALLKAKGSEVLATNVGYEDATMDDSYWPYGAIAFRAGDDLHTYPVTGPYALIRALSRHYRPDGSEVT